jgi:hypothetical protein
LIFLSVYSISYAGSEVCRKPLKLKIVIQKTGQKNHIDDTYCTFGSQTVSTGTGTVIRRCVAFSSVSMADAIHLVGVCLNGRQQ